MAFDNKSLEIIVSKIKVELIGSTIGKPIFLGNRDYAFIYSKEENNKYVHRALVFSLNPSFPYVTFTKEKLEPINNVTAFFSSLKKISYTKVIDIEKISNERVVVISLKANDNDLSETNTGYDLIFELFPNHPNCYIIAHPSNKIISLYKEFTNIEKGIFVVKNATYTFPNLQKENKESFSSFDEANLYFPNNLFRVLKAKSKDDINAFNSLFNEINKSKQLYIINNEILPFHFHEKGAKVLNVEEIYSFLNMNKKDENTNDDNRDLIIRLNKIIASNDKKIKNLESDLKKAQNNLIYKEYGQLIYMYQSDIKPNSKELKTDKCIIPLDPKLSVSNNANNYFKKYRKAKTAIEILSSLIEKSKQEGYYLKKKLIEASDGNQRDISELKSELLDAGYIKREKGKKYIQKTSKNRKYLPHFINLDNCRIGFGMNGLQNEELTFKIANDENIFIHVKDYPGSHVIVFDNYDEESILLGCELALYLSHLTNGELIVTKKKNVKKNSERIGLVKIKKYNSIVVKDIRKKSIDIFQSIINK